MFMSRSFKAVSCLMSLWGIAWLTCMQNVEAWRILGNCSSRCHLKMWSLGPPYLEDVPCTGMVRKLSNILNGFVKKVVQPDDMIFFVCLLSACSHSCLMDEGMCCYSSMITVYLISATLECNTCMVGLLCCTGHLQEAENMMKAMPCKPHVAPSMVLLGNCRIHGNVEMGEHVAKQILGLEPGNAAGYMLLSKIYAAAGNRHLSESVEWPRKEKGVKKQPDCT